MFLVRTVISKVTDVNKKGAQCQRNFCKGRPGSRWKARKTFSLKSSQMEIGPYILNNDL